MNFRGQIRTLLAAALCCIALSPQSAVAAEEGAAAEGVARAGGRPVKTVSVRLEPGQTVFSLGVRFVSKGSFKLRADGVELTLDRDYMLDYTSGTVLLRRSYPMGADLRAELSYLPLDLEEVYGGPWEAGGSQVATPSTRTTRSPGANPSQGEEREGSSGSSLTVGGSKRLAFEFGGGRDLAVSQSLDLDIRGTVGRDVEVRAVLSDRNLPVIPEGNTQTLEELDEVYVKVISPSVNATFGDYTLTGPPSEFGRMSRTVEGVQASAAWGDEGVQVATASPRGRFNSAEFMGEEGKQGAYYIDGAEGGAATIVPGSEKVWVDGVQMRRGAAADYTIDYASGAITFTSARPITKDSRITVDYEFSFEVYRRSLYAVSGRTEAGPLGVTASYAVERDNENSALSGTISDEDRSRFEEMGDAVADHASPDTSSAPQEASPARPPASHELVDVALAYSPWAPLSLRTEVALSDFDQNTFSGRDDSDNKGTAVSFRADLSPRAVSLAGRSLGRIEAAAKVRRTEDSFASMGRMSPAMDYDRWNLPAGALGGGEERSEASMRYRPAGAISVEAEAGHIALENGGASSVLRLSSSAAGARGYVVSWENADTRWTGYEGAASKRDRGLAQLRWALGPLGPAVAAETERRRDGAGGGADYTRVGGELKVGSGGLTGVASMSVRQDYSIDSGVRGRESNAFTQSYGFVYRGDSKLGLDGRYSLRSLAIDSTGAQVNTYVAHLDGAGGAVNGALGWRGSYEVTSTDEGPRTVVFVGPGNGHYDADGRYVGIGDFELDESGGNAGLSSKVIMNLSSDVDWGRANGGSDRGGLGAVLSSARWSGLYRHEEHTKTAVAAPGNIFNPESYMNPKDVIRGSSLSRHDLELLPRGRVLSPRIRYEVRKKLRRSGENGLSGGKLSAFSVRLRSRAVPGATLEGEQVWGASTSDGTAGSAKRETLETKASVIVRPGRGTNLSLRSSYLLDSSPDAGGGARWEIEPAAGYSRPGALSVEARLRWARADRDGGLSYDQLLGWLGDRVEYSVSGQVGLGAGLTLLGTMRATGMEWGELSHYFKMEMRALF
jgi:hypothetical protein